MLCVSMEDNLKARAVLTSIQIRKKKLKRVDQNSLKRLDPVKVPSSTNRRIAVNLGIVAHRCVW